MPTTSVYRIADGWHPGEDSVVFLAGDGFRIDVSEQSYRENGFHPSFDTLPFLSERVIQAE